MAHITTYPFEKDKLEELKSYPLGLNWPVVYIQENGKEMYIGQTTNIYSRSKQHYEKENRARLKKIHVLSDTEFNMSAAYDLESLLIQYISAEGVYKLQNRNSGLINHNYFEREKYQAKIDAVWSELQEKKLTFQSMEKIKNTEFFKFSPYKALTEDQLLVVRRLERQIKKGEQRSYIVNGGPGTGKSILALYLLKYLREHEETSHLSIALVVPMTGLRKTLQRVVSRVPGMNAQMIIGPSDVAKKSYDLLLVDEAHRLRRRVNLSNFGSYDATTKKLGLPKDATQLDWILACSKQQVFFYDKRQSVVPGDIRSTDFKNLKALEYELTSQMRIEGGDDYLKMVDDLFALRAITAPKNYDFQLYSSIHQMIEDIKAKDAEHSLSRVVAGYAWSWATKGGKEGYDIEIDGLKLIWNRTNIDWVNSENALNEIGCIHTIQGYDLNYVGVIVGPELSYDENKAKIVVDEKKYKDINGKRSITGPEELRAYIMNIYKTLLTRGIKGTYVYIVDDKLREKMFSLLS